MRDDFISRWSRRKLASKAGPVPAAADAIPAQAAIQPVTQPPAASETPPVPAQPLPPVESLTPESDFTPFMKPEVDPSLKRAALKTLFSDPRFNVMDGLDVYIDDYSKPDPLPPEWLGQMNQMKYLGHYIEEVPAESAKEAETGATQSADAMQEEAAAFPPREPSADTLEADANAAEIADSNAESGVGSPDSGVKLHRNEA